MKQVLFAVPWMDIYVIFVKQKWVNIVWPWHFKWSKQKEDSQTLEKWTHDAGEGIATTHRYIYRIIPTCRQQLELCSMLCQPGWDRDTSWVLQFTSEAPQYSSPLRQEIKKKRNLSLHPHAGWVRNCDMASLEMFRVRGYFHPGCFLLYTHTAPRAR